MPNTPGALSSDWLLAHKLEGCDWSRNLRAGPARRSSVPRRVAASTRVAPGGIELVSALLIGGEL